MKNNLKSLLILLLLLTANAAAVSAKTWRLNPNVDAAAPFHSLSEALASEEVQPGDELLLDPGTYEESSLVISKPDITITGPGYGLTENTDWAESRSAIINCTSSLQIQANGVTLQGLVLQNGITYRVDSNGNNIDGGTIQRCHLSYVRGFDSSKFPSHITIRQNLFQTTDRANIEGVTHCTINNNIFKGNIQSCKYSAFENNCFIETRVTALHYFSNSYIRNNIITCYGDVNVMTGEVIYGNNVISNNIFSCTEPSDKFPDNIWQKYALNEIFVEDTGLDGYFLREDSPAKGMASDGGDCGIFGGATPYVQSGRPANMPHITSAVIPSSPTNGEITVKLNIAVSND